MITREDDEVRNGVTTCASVGMDFGAWSSKQITVELSHFLRQRNENDKLWIGLTKMAHFRLEDPDKDHASCIVVATSNAHQLLRWTASKDTVSSKLFEPPNALKIQDCNELAIAVSLDKARNRLIFQDSKKTKKKKFICIKETGNYMSLES